MADPVLSVRGLHVKFVGSGRPVSAVRGIDFDVFSNEVLGIVGESGSGKSVTSLAIAGACCRQPLACGGSVMLGGVAVAPPTGRRLRNMRGRDVGMIFQDPTTTVEPGAADRQADHRGPGGARARLRPGAVTGPRAAIELLREVDIPDPAGRVDQYPHQFSGGMRQRVVIAIGDGGAASAS